MHSSALTAARSTSTVTRRLRAASFAFALRRARLWRALTLGLAARLFAARSASTATTASRKIRSSAKS